MDFSTGSVGLGAVITTFSAYVQDWLLLKGFLPRQISPEKGRTIALVGDAELDEGASDQHIQQYLVGIKE